MGKEVIILAGGLGTRLRSVIDDVPKCMAPVAGRPFLWYLLRYLSHFDVEKVILSVGYLRLQPDFFPRYLHILRQDHRHDPILLYLFQKGKRIF